MPYKQRRKNKVVASMFIWYKVAKEYQLAHPATRTDKPKAGIISHQPNEYLHIDTTYYRMKEDGKVCITFVIDNYSKMILGLKISEKLCFDLVKGALQNALEVIDRHPNQWESLLVSDRGRENHNEGFNTFIASITSQKITKIRAIERDSIFRFTGGGYT